MNAIKFNITKSKALRLDPVMAQLVLDSKDKAFEGIRAKLIKSEYTNMNNYLYILPPYKINKKYIKHG